MYKWSGVIFAKKSKFHDEGGPDTVVSPYTNMDGTSKSIQWRYYVNENQSNVNLLAKQRKGN